MLLDEIKSLMENACAQGKGPFDTVFFERHVRIMAETADALAAMLQADREIVGLAAYLHDLAAVEDYDSVTRHHILGGERAEEILSQHGYPSERIAAVRQCILTHSAPVALGQGTLEEICISNADAAAQILMPGYWLYYAFAVKQFGYTKGLAWYEEKINSHWSGMIDAARKLVSDTYHASLAFLAAERKNAPSGV